MPPPWRPSHLTSNFFNFTEEEHAEQSARFRRVREQQSRHYQYFMESVESSRVPTERSMRRTLSHDEIQLFFKGNHEEENVFLLHSPPVQAKRERTESLEEEERGGNFHFENFSFKGEPKNERDVLSWIQRYHEHQLKAIS